jgi:signal transduction histidine kinase
MMAAPLQTTPGESPLPPEPETPSLPEGRILLDATGHVTSADESALEALGLPRAPGKAGLAALEAGLGASGLIPAREGPNTSFRQALIPGTPPRMIEIAACRAGDDSWTIALRQLSERRGWLGDQADQVRFLANFSHELRTPLTTLKASLALVDRSREQLPAKAQELLTASRRNVARLINIVADLMDITTISAGQLDLKLKDEDPRELIGAALTRTRDRTGRPDLGEGPCEDSLPTVRADRARVLRVLEELLDNAVKCTEPGSGIEAAARVDGGHVRFLVTDHGPGIPEDQVETIFRPFQQLDMSLTRGVPGLGLGLAICKGIVEEHGGGLTVEPGSNGGCIFSFTLPLGGDD